MSAQWRPNQTSLWASTKAETEVTKFTQRPGFGRKLYLIKNCQILIKNHPYSTAPMWRVTKANRCSSDDVNTSFKNSYILSNQNKV